MPQSHVRDVMTTDVITAPENASLSAIAAILIERDIGAVPIINRFDVVVGVVSWSDLHHKIDIDVAHATGWSWLRRRVTSPLTWPAGTAVDVMSAPPITIGPDESLPTAARMMYRKQIGRLLVADNSQRLRGILARSDLLKCHGRLDAVIHGEITQRILQRTLMLTLGTIHAAVNEGVVTLTGHTDRKSTAVIAAELIQAVAGVTDVIDGLSYEVDDTVAAPAAGPRPVAGRSGTGPGFPVPHRVPALAPTASGGTLSPVGQQVPGS